MSGNSPTQPANLLTGLLVDTWWYGLSGRLTGEQFTALAQLRVSQGFSAVQLVAGIPPEVGPENEHAASTAGPAWTLAGTFNQDYLALARERVQTLNDLGLRVIVYGAWGQQMRWLGRQRMAGWWRELINHLDDLDVIYCLTGESNLWIGDENMLLPDRTTADMPRAHPPPWLPGRVWAVASKIRGRLRSRRKKPDLHLAQQRKADWSFVLEEATRLTIRPFLIHPNHLETGFQAVNNPHLLAANTTQTGHNLAEKNKLWQMPLEHFKHYPSQLFINLEPWYEGIHDNFYAAAQLFAYWTSMLAGAASFCYGAHGIWNVGDGRFLAHWGSQTFAEAQALSTPALLGLSHKLFLSLPKFENAGYEMSGNDLLYIRRWAGESHITYIPDVTRLGQLPAGKIWLPLAGQFAAKIPAAGAVVIADFS